MSYQDYVIKDGKFIGKFDEMYQKFKDPWNLAKLNSKGGNFDYQIINLYCNQLKQLKKKKLKTLEIGSGYPFLSNLLYKNNNNIYATDISETVIKKSKIIFPKFKRKLFVSEFINFKLYNKINPDVIILSDVSWYVLPNIKKFLNWFKKLNKKTYLIHSLSIYSKNKQKYGKKYFCDTKSMLKFFNLEYLNITSVKHSIRGDGKQIFFLAHNR